MTTYAQDGPGYFLDEHTKDSIRQDVGSLEPGTAYVFDQKLKKWRKVTRDDYKEFE